jgi:hypothetical protein
MKIKNLTAILFFALSFSIANAQKFELGKVSIAELQEKAHPKDSSAVAAILFKTGTVKFVYSDIDGFVMTTEVKERIKIYKKEGYDWANHAERYYIGGNTKETVSFTDAVTYNLVDGKIEKTKLKSDGEFDQKVNKYWGQKKIAMPNIKVGSVIEYAYTIRSERFGAMRDWYFQSSIPVNHSEFKTFIPEYFVYKPNQKGFVFLNVTVEKKTNSITINSKERSSGGYGFSGVTTTFSSDKIDFQETRTNYVADNLPAMKDEAYVNNIDNYTSSITHELSMTQFPNSIYKSYSTDWESVTKTIYDYDDFGVELNKTGYFEDDINKLLVGLNTQDEKVDAIFNFVKSKVKWDDYKGYSCNDGVKTAYKNKTGNVAEINLMLTAMLRYAKINANPVILSTRANGIALYPSTEAFNYVIAAVEIQNGLILLDATEKYSLPNILPLEDLNWNGRLIRNDGTSTEVDLMSKTLSREATNMGVVVKSDGSADGKIRVQLTDHEALKFRKENLATNKESYLEKLETENNNIEVSDYVRENDLDLSKPIVESYSFKDTKSVEVINGKIYISPMLFLTAKVNPFKQEVREYPVDFGYPTQNKYNINIEIPEGYVVESMPASINIATGDDIGAFKYMIVNTDNKIQVVITSTINTAIVSSDFYPVLKGYYQQMIDKQNEKIVLKKI